MAQLEVEVRLDAGVSDCSLYIDGLPVTLAGGHRGEAWCEGLCGDGSSHALMYSFSGAEGSSLSIVLKCGDRTICRIASARLIERAGRQAGRHLFDL